MWRIWAAFVEIVGLAVVAGPGVHAQNARQSCLPYGRPITIDFATSITEPIYNNLLNVAGIRNLLLSRSQPMNGPHQRALGVTYVDTILSFDGSYTIIPRGVDGYCVYLNKVGAQFGWSRMEVFVASDYRPGSCEYNAVLDHENQHVAIARDAVHEFAPVLRAELEKILSDQQPIYTRNTETAPDAALASIRQRMDAALRSYQLAAATRNAAIDTSSNYNATAALCPNWDKAPKKR